MTVRTPAPGIPCRLFKERNRGSDFDIHKTKTTNSKQMPSPRVERRTSGYYDEELNRKLEAQTATQTRH